MAEIRSPIQWAGGKARLLPQILPHIPKDFTRYIEPFVGGGSMFIHLAMEENIDPVLNDTNESLMNMYRVIRSYPTQLMDYLDAMKELYNEEMFHSVKSAYNAWINPGFHLSIDVYQAAAFIFLNKTCFNGLYRVNKDGQFNVGWCKKEKCPQLYNAHNIRVLSHLLSHSTLRCRDAIELIRNYATVGDFIYCDPPYDTLSKTANFTQYGKRTFDKGDHVKLKIVCEDAVNRGASVVISNSDTPFIRELYQDHKIVEIQAARTINCDPTKRGKVTELLIIMGGTK